MSTLPAHHCRLLDWLTPAERNPPSLALDAPLAQAVRHFEEEADLRLLPVVDGVNKPTGAIFEKDVRRLLLNPFGHALLRNPAYGRRVDALIRPCPVADLDGPERSILDVYAAENGQEGMILTRKGRLFAVISNRRLIRLAADEQLHDAERQMARARRIEAASERIEAEIAALADQLRGLAAGLRGGATATADRAAINSAAANALAAALAQRRDNLAAIARETDALAATLDAIGRDTVTARASTAEAVQLVDDSRARIVELDAFAQTIGTVTSVIGGIAGQVNLLALNAAIEAARAGPAGAGFTVVAHEVKLLAGQAGRAAENVGAQVAAIRAAVDRVTANHERVEAAIGAIAALTRNVECAVREQHIATHTIAQNVAESVESTDAVQGDITRVGESASAAARNATSIAQLSSDLLGGAEQLSAGIHRFLSELHAA